MTLGFVCGNGLDSGQGVQHGEVVPPDTHRNAVVTDSVGRELSDWL